MVVQLGSNVVDTFFTELRQYNSSNFKALKSIDITNSDPSVNKAFSSVITRYFIFCEKHPELSDEVKRLLYYQLKIDMIARFFSNYPNSNSADLVAFQTELMYYVTSNCGGDPVE